jgi:ubiquinone/menaquinone biosynthesis C-methylase UbiE
MDQTHRFSNRVDNYTKYRPDYPPAVATFFLETLGMTPDSVVADVGSGTGKLSAIFLDAGATILAVEPNDEMREAAERAFGALPNFRSVAARAEATSLADASVDFVVVGQAFHWFDAVEARREFVRILVPGGHVALVWNERRLVEDSFAADYEALMVECCPEYPTSTRRSIQRSALEAFFAPAPMRVVTFDNSQTLDFEGLRGRIHSSSYAPVEGPAYERLTSKLPELFAIHERDGYVTMAYDTEVFHGRLEAL